MAAEGSAQAFGAAPPPPGEETNTRYRCTIQRQPSIYARLAAKLDMYLPLNAATAAGAAAPGSNQAQLDKPPWSGSTKRYGVVCQIRTETGLSPSAEPQERIGRHHGARVAGLGVRAIPADYVGQDKAKAERPDRIDQYRHAAGYVVRQ